MRALAASLYLTASENISEDNSWEDGGAYEMWTPETRRARIDELRVIVVDIPSMYAWIQESPVFALRRDLACIDEFLEHGASSADATILGSARFFVDRELYVRERAITAAPASGGSGGMGDSGADNMVKVRNILDTFLNVRVTIDKDDMPDLYPDTSFAKRQPLAILRQDNFEALDAAIDGKVMCVRSMMQTFKTASQVGFMLLELARGNMVCMLMGSEGGAVDKYTENVRDIIAIIEKECRAPYTICFAKGDDMADAIARHEAGHPVVVIALAHHTQLAKIYDGLAKGCYFDKVAIIIDEVHSKMSPPKTIGGPEHSLRCSYMKELIKGSSRAYLVTATSADVVFNIDDGSFGIPGDQIQYITGPDANWIGWPLYLGIDSLTPFVRTEGSFCRHRYVKETLFGCDASQTAINLTSNMDVLNQVDTERWCPAYRAFIEEANGLQGFVFTRPTYIRNVLINTELVNMIHLKAFDCVTVMIHGTASTNAKANDKFDLVVEPGIKSAYPCIVMWRDPDSAFWTDANVAANATREAWCAAVQYRAFKSWTDACKDEEVRQRVARRMIFMSTNLGGGSVSIVQKTLGRSITHIAVAHMSDYNNVIQMIGRAFHNQPDVRVMCMRHGAADSSEDDRERFVHGKPIVRAFMSAQDIGDLKEYFHLTDEMCANKRRFDTVGGGNALYTRPATAFLRGNEVGLGVAKVMRRVAAHAKLDVGAADAQKEWGEDHCPDHIEAVAMWEEQREQHEQQGDVTLSLWGEAAARKPSATVLETDMDVVFRFDGVTAEMIDAGAYKWSVSYPITSTARFANGSGTHQPNNCPVHLAHMGGSSYKNIWVIDEVRGCVEIKVLKVERERAREMDGETFTWTRYDSGVWVENTHQAGDECSSEACSRRRRAMTEGVGVDGDMASGLGLLRDFCALNKGFCGGMTDFNNGLAATFHAEYSRLVTFKTAQGHARPNIVIGSRTFDALIREKVIDVVKVSPMCYRVVV